MRLALVIAALVGLMLVPVLIFDDEIDTYFAGEEGLRRLQEYGAWAWLVAIGLIVSDLVMPVPSTAVIAALGMMYGPWLGGTIGGAGSTLAGLVAYGGCRLLGQRVLDIVVGAANLDRLRRFFERHGLWTIALSRWLPLLPEALCCLAGMARMRLAPFLAALACGSLAMGFAFAFLGMSYLDRPVVGLVVSALIPLAVWPLIAWWMRKTPPTPTAPVSAQGIGE
ncbi:MAG: VTT domain-containing protein [Gemmataceae bacterium]|nr:VTT domain-containing protein [Gemmataceae bacterium]